MNLLPQGPRLHKICYDNSVTRTYDGITLLFDTVVDLLQDSGLLCLPNG